MISVFAFIILLAELLYFGKGNTVVSSSESESISKKVTNLIEKEENKSNTKKGGNKYERNLFGRRLFWGA